MMIFVFPRGSVLSAFFDLGTSASAIQIGTCFESRHLFEHGKLVMVEALSLILVDARVIR